MAAPRQIAVLDVGKTNVKVAVVDRPGRREIAVETTPNIVRRDGPYPHYDVAHLWAFFEDAITRLARVHAIDGISITAHGASIVLLGDDELALPVLDYEYDGPYALTSEYNALRPDFAETQSPRLPGGLTVGAQIHWLEHSFPDGFARTRFILTYPQYWAWRLTGIATNEVTSLGCHTDLWQPAARTWSSLVEKTGWGRLMAPVHDATVPLGPLKQALARRWGLADDMPVACGIHDSNASLLPHLLDHTPPFTVVSTGTWAISFAVGATAQRLDPDRDTLANVNVFGDPVPSARFMGGREFELMTEDAPVPIDASAIDRVLEQGIMVLPAVLPESGPFQGRTARWSHDPSTLSPALRTAAAGLYLACMTQTCRRARSGDRRRAVRRERPLLQRLGLVDRAGRAGFDGQCHRHQRRGCAVVRGSGRDGRQEPAAAIRGRARRRAGRGGGALCGALAGSGRRSLRRVRLRRSRHSARR